MTIPNLCSYVKKLMLLDVTLTKLLDIFMKQEQLNPKPFEMLRQEIKEMNKVIMTEFKEGNLLKENANYESTPIKKD